MNTLDGAAMLKKINGSTDGGRVFVSLSVSSSSIDMALKILDIPAMSPY